MSITLSVRGVFFSLTGELMAAGFLETHTHTRTAD